MNEAAMNIQKQLPFEHGLSSLEYKHPGVTLLDYMVKVGLTLYKFATGLRDHSLNVALHISRALQLLKHHPNAWHYH
jgi:hypothetical protein